MNEEAKDVLAKLIAKYPTGNLFLILAGNHGLNLRFATGLIRIPEQLGEEKLYALSDVVTVSCPTWW